MDIGFIGLGQMGRSMAANLLKAGHNLTVWNRSPERTAELRAKGAKVAATPAEAATTGVVITMLADDHAVESVVFGSDGILGGLAAGVHVSMSTISVSLSERLVTAHRELGQQYVAAPVFGRPEAAAAAKLFLVAAGPAPAIRLCQPLFDAVGQRTFLLGEKQSSANVLKLAGNFLIASTLETFGEAFALARKSGVDPEKFLEVLNGTIFTAPFQVNYGGIIAREAYEPAGFPAKLGLKDLRLVLAAADAAGVPMPAASLVRDRFQAAIGRGHRDRDWSVIAKLAAEDSGL